MKNSNRSKLIIGLFSMIALASGYINAAPMSDGAVMCDKCKMVMVKVPNATSSKSPMTTYHDSSTMVCPDCTSAMNNFFTTGKLKHTCSHCGGTMTHCVH